MQRQTHHIELTVEHRTDVSPEPFCLKLADSQEMPHLEVMDTKKESDHVRKTEHNDLKNQLLDEIKNCQKPISQVKLRRIVKARNQTVGLMLMELQDERRIFHNENGWMIMSTM
jgi:hypothetical protein